MVRGRGAFAGANEWHVHAHVIRLCQALFEAGIADIGLLALQSVLVSKIHQLLDFFDEIVGLIDRIVTEHIYRKSAGLAHQRLANASGTDDGENLAGDLVAQKWQKWMPCAPAIFADFMFARP